jgi:hypothetical protein
MTPAFVIRTATLVLGTVFLASVVALAVPETRAVLAKALDPRRPYEPGEKVDLGLSEPIDACMTVAIVAAESCSYCEASVPFFQRLVEALPASRVCSRVLLLAADRGAQSVEYAHRLGLSERGYRLDPSRTRVVGVPTVFVLDAQRHLVASYVGVQPLTRVADIVGITDRVH